MKSAPPCPPPKGWLRVERCDYRYESGRRCMKTTPHFGEHSLVPGAGNSSVGMILSDYVLVRIARKR